MKKLWGIIVCVLLIGGGSIAGFLYGERGITTTSASTGGLRDSITVSMTDTHRIGNNGITIFDSNEGFFNMIGYVYIHENGTREIRHFDETRTDLPNMPSGTPIERMPVPLLGFDVYGGKFGSHAFINNDRFSGTTATFSADFGADWIPVPFRYEWTREVTVDGDTEIITDLQNTQTWANVFERDTVNAPTRTAAPHPRRVGPNITMEGAPPRADSFEYGFEDTGVYEFVVTTAPRWIWNATHERRDPIDTNHIDNQVQIRFAMVVRKQPTELTAHLPQNRDPFMRDNRIVRVGTDLALDRDIFVEFRYASGFHTPFQNARFISTTPAVPVIEGLPAFMEFRGVRAQSTDADGNIIPQALRLGIRYGHTPTAGRFGVRETVNHGVNTYELDPESTIFVRAEFPGFDNMTALGVPGVTGEWHRETLRIGFLFIEPEPSPGFQHWGIITGAVVLIGLAGGFVLVNKFALSVQMRDIRKKRKKEELAEKKKYENKRKMREASGDGGHDFTDDDGVN